MPKRRNPSFITSLPPRIENRLERQALSEARAANAPLIQAKRRALKANRRAFRQDKRSIRGVASVTASAIDAAIKEAKQSGLKGQYLQQTLRELEARKASIPDYVQSERSLARQDLRANQATARSDIFDARADMLKQAQTEYSQDRDTILTAERQRLKEKAARQRADKKDEKTPKLTPTQKRSRDLARVSAMTSLESLLRQAENPPKSKQDWEDFAILVAQRTEGAGIPDALWAVHAYLKKRAGGRRFVGGQASGQLG